MFVCVKFQLVINIPSKESFAHFSLLGSHSDVFADTGLGLLHLSTTAHTIQLIFCTLLCCV